KGRAMDDDPTTDYWRPWKTTFLPTPDFAAYPSPIFADIEFDTNEDLILIFDDRYGSQMGTMNLGTDPNDGNTVTGVASGDILRASYNGSSYTLESNGTAGSNTSAGAGNGEGPGGGEFYFGDHSTTEYSDYHHETVMGGSALKAGSGEVSVAAYDPFDVFSTGIYWMSNTLGTTVDKYQVNETGQVTGSFGKTNGLGDIELLCNPAPIEIGNRVWLDSNGDGVQDPGEAPIQGVTVQLLKSGSVIATATTDAQGRYVFSNDPTKASGASTDPFRYNITQLTANMAYTVHFPTTATVSGTTYSLTSQNSTTGAGVDDWIDSDATSTGDVSILTTDIPTTGANNHTFDVGYKLACSISVTASNDGPKCAGSTITLSSTPSGGTAPYTYSWSGPSSFTSTVQSPSLTNVTSAMAGTYTVTITDDASCTGTATTDVVVSASPSVSCDKVDNSNCASPNGSATATAAGVTYVWSNGGTTAMISNLSGGTYTVTVTSTTTGCTATCSTTVGTTAGAPSVSCDKVDNSNCASPNGSATATAAGVTYVWSNGGTTASISNLSAGTYTVTVTSTTTGCTATCSTTVGTTAGAPSVSCDKVDNSNCATPNGSATATAAGVTYVWSNGGTTAMISNLSGGTYTVTVTSTTTGCTATCSTTVATTASAPSVSCNKVDNSNCATPNGSATATATGVTYLWSNGGTTAAISNLSAGTYTVTVTSTTSSCTATCSSIVASTTTPPSVTCNKVDNTNCTTPNGSATASASGVTYAWSNGGTTATINNLSAGTYTVTVTSTTTGCTATCSTTVATTTTPPSVTCTPTQPTCLTPTSGSVAASASGGTGTLSYTWSNGGSSSSISGLGAGTYSVTVSDQNNCTSTCSSVLNAPTGCCSITSITASVGTCDPGTNEYTVSGAISFSASPSSGTLTVTVGPEGANKVFNAPFTSPLTYSISGLDSDGLTHTVTAVFSADPTCNISASFTAPDNCYVPVDECFTTSITVQAGTCDPATNFYSLTGQIAFGSVIPTNSITVNISGGGTVTLNPPFTNPQSFTVNNLFSDGLTHVVTMTMNTIGSCTNSASYDAPVVCNCPIAPYEICPSESYTLDAAPGYTNYQWYTITGGVPTAITGAISQSYVVTTTGIYTWTANDSQVCPVNSCCEYEFIEGNCCTISAQLTTPQCLNNGTVITSDDMFGFYVNVSHTGVTPTTGWTASNGFSGKYDTNIAIGPLSISGSASPLIITIIDSAISACTTTIQVTPPPPCSSCPTGDCIKIKSTKN
ncbi:MAG: hypothetical protein KA010_04060, partial [Saprospiraceae bacterium]|nr:hypothetical protein [Saprospiraceae bacterium]